MADIVMFPQDGGMDENEPTFHHDTFLKDEGLELLAAYRRISDPLLRMSLMQLVKALAMGKAREGGKR